MRNLLKNVPLLALSTMLLAGCATHEHRLNPIGSESVISGKLIHGNISTPDQLIVETTSKRFAGDLVVTSYLDRQKFSKLYRFDRRHWRRITSGLDRDHQTFIGNAELKADDGELMRCKVTWSRTNKPWGECSDKSGSFFRINFE